MGTVGLSPTVTTEQRASADRTGLLFASGLITGEALVGIALAVPFALKQSTDVWNIAPESFSAPILGAPITVTQVLGLLGFAFFVTWLYRVAQRTT